jgi:hypothetical protein
MRTLLRLAQRLEGGYVNFYLAQADTMDEAILLGSIDVRFVIDNEQRELAFVDLMRDCAADVVYKTTGMKVEVSKAFHPPPKLN